MQETKGMISKELIAKMRPDAILVNVAVVPSWTMQRWQMP